MRMTGAAVIGILSFVLTGLPCSQADQKPDTRKIAKLVEQLGDDDFDLREQASAALASLGEDALDALIRAAAASKDPEICWRAEVLLRAAGVPNQKLAVVLVPTPADFEFLRTIKGKSRIATLKQFGHPHEVDRLADGAEHWKYTRNDGNLFWVFFRSGVATHGMPIENAAWFKF